MGNDIWRRQEIESPCVKICLIHPTERICTGCFRTLEEIAGWSGMTAEERHAIMAALPDRAPRLIRRRGGHAARLAARGGSDPT
ncbi:DUF1289 domain-containing protein [Pseudodonghicola xiamenensis]|uniref:DUF1289 domain-containing protein n=1 Tax=Pseudodonghicola xiamenensis TaxID=337702 RepID=A0A8J3MCR5_9RHOB|nr:DUF1289 domain-containing protein [Pseudodonghicola xiamenensis]GHG93262.1 DUF1289 domain-containing protein [Pseudodonghicola xiamenensis]